MKALEYFSPPPDWFQSLLKPVISLAVSVPLYEADPAPVKTAPCTFHMAATTYTRKIGAVLGLRYEKRSLMS